MSKQSFIAVLLLSISACGDGSSGPVGPAPTSTISGQVLEAATGAPVVGATVTAGTLSATTGATGNFEIRNVPTGASVTLSVTAAGFETATETFAVAAGTNARNISLARKTNYETSNGFLIHLPPGTGLYRGAMVVIHGGNVDSRPMLRGEFAYYDPFPLSGDVTEYRRRVLLFAEQKRLVVVTAQFNSTSEPNATRYDDMVVAMNQVAQQSGHSELAHAAFLLHGHSLGACSAYGFTRLHAERIVGVIASKGLCAESVDSGAAAAVPIYLIVGENDNTVSASQILSVFTNNRAAGAPWSYGVEAGAGHAQVTNHDLLFGWLGTILDVRVPQTIVPSQPVQLRAVDQTLGWLGNMTTFEVASYASYTADRNRASWLPSQATALEWQGMNAAR
jgi:dienelactone hydrolase